MTSKDLCALIPHSGTMCLIDAVEYWNDEQIICTTNTHHNSDNPLCRNNKLPISALIEYGAQAMAIHGAILAKASGEAMQEGYLAALRDIQFSHHANVDTIESLLVIQATRKLASQGNMIYNFLVKSNDKNLISGRATVVAVFN